MTGAVLGRANIMKLLGIADWRTVEKLAERQVDPLSLQWDALDRPWLDLAEYDAWLTRNNRGHRYMRVERRVKADPVLLERLGDLLPAAAPRRKVKNKATGDRARE
jgi:hypothetical protein